VYSFARNLENLSHLNGKMTVFCVFSKIFGLLQDSKRFTLSFFIRSFTDIFEVIRPYYPKICAVYGLKINVTGDTYP